jgi:hypothetical protein
VDKTEQHNLIDLLAAFTIEKDGKPAEMSIRSETDLIQYFISSFSTAHDTQPLFTQGQAKPVMSSPEIILNYLLVVYQKLQEVNSQQREARWKPLVELPICVDKPQREDVKCTLKDEYIVWAN